MKKTNYAKPGYVKEHYSNNFFYFSGSFSEDTGKFYKVT